jgi:hypothetical protein
MTQNKLDPNEVIDALGGTSQTARLCEVSDPAVAQWRTDGIPKSRLMFLRLAAPEVFAKLEAKAPEEDKRKRPRRSGKDRRVVATRRTEDLAK